MVNSIVIGAMWVKTSSDSWKSRQIENLNLLITAQTRKRGKAQHDGHPFLVWVEITLLFVTVCRPKITY